MDKAVHCKSISVILCNKSIAKVGLALGQYIIGDITPSFYDLQKTVYEGTYFFSDFRAGHGSCKGFNRQLYLSKLIAFRILKLNFFVLLSKCV